jgi:hypothetical protein
MQMKQDDEIKYLQRLVTENGLSRRNFLTAAMALGVGAMAPALYSQAALAAPKRGGRLRQGLTGGATTDVLDPGQILDSYMINLQFGQLRNNMTEVAASGELVGELAESWEANADATQWVFNIRKGVEFHNGKTLDSQDVVDSLKHHFGENSKSAAAGILTGVDNVKADGKNTVVVNLKGGDADFPFILSDYHILICPSNGDGSIGSRARNSLLYETQSQLLERRQGTFRRNRVAGSRRPVGAHHRPANGRGGLHPESGIENRWPTWQAAWRESYRHHGQQAGHAADAHGYSAL